MSQASSPFKRGIVREVDAENARAKVEFEDEDGASSYWLSVNSVLALGGGSRVYLMPEIGSQVHCLVDWRGEDGTVLGASYSKVDRPPTSNGKLVKASFDGGVDIQIDKATGSMKIEMPGILLIKIGGTMLKITPSGIYAEAGEYEWE